MSNSEFTYFYRSSDYGSSWSNRGNVDFKPFDNNSFAVSSVIQICFFLVVLILVVAPMVELPGLWLTTGGIITKI
jgi:hypothetical protein